MKNLQIGLFLVALIVSLPSASRAQDTPLSPELKQNPEVQLREFENAFDPNQEYELGRGDEITVEVIGRPELSGKHVIGPDGRITLPIVGSVQLVNLTRGEAAKAIKAKFDHDYADTTVSVGVDKYTSNHILLLGAVERPGLMTFDQPPTILEVVTRGGVQVQGTAPGAAPGTMTIPNRPPVVPERCVIYRGNSTRIEVDLKSALELGKPEAQFHLKRDDIVYIPSPTERYVSVLGEVPRPGTQQLDSTSTLPKLLAQAGGIGDKAGRYPNIQIIQASTGKTRIISYKEVLMPQKLDLTLHSGDIIYVPQSGFDHAAGVLTKLSPLINLFTIAALFTQ